MISILRRAIRSRLGENILSQFVLTGFSHIAPFLLIPFFISTIGIEKYGALALSIGLGAYLLCVFDWGFNISNVKPIVEARENPDAITQVVSGTFWAKSILIALLCPIYLLLVFYVPLLLAHKSLFILGYFWAIGTTSNLSWLYRAMEDMKRVAQITLVVKLFALSPIFFVVRDETDYVWPMVFYSLEAWSATLLSWRIAYKRYGVRLLAPNLSLVLSMLKSSYPFFVSSIFARIYQLSGVLILGFSAGEATAGLYNVAEKLYNAYASFALPLVSHVFYPYFSRIKELKRITTLILSAVVLNTILLVTIGGASFVFLPMFFPDVASSIQVPFLLFLLVLAIAIPSELLGFPMLGILGGNTLVIRTTIMASLVYTLGLICIYILDVLSVPTAILCLFLANTAALIGRWYYIVLIKKRKVIQE